MLTEQIKALIQKANVHGLALSVITNKELIYQQHFGLKNRDANQLLGAGTAFYGASFSKAIFAYTVMKLVEDKVIDLDTPLYKYLEEPLPSYQSNFIKNFFGGKTYDYKPLEGDERYKLITARMCLSHTSGLPNWRFIEADKKLKIKTDPGTHYSYSGEGIYLLQFVIEQKMGRDLESFASQYVFKPLGMKNTSYVWQDAFKANSAVGHNGKNKTLGVKKKENSNAAESLTTTLEDFTRFYLALLNQQGLKPSSFQEMFSPQIRIKSKQQFGPNARINTNENDSIALSYGLGFGLLATPHGKAFFKEGHADGWQHYSIGFPDKGTAIILMTNSDNGESIFKELLQLTIGDTYTPGLGKDTSLIIMHEWSKTTK